MTARIKYIIGEFKYVWFAYYTSSENMAQGIGMPAWAVALVGVLAAVLFIALFYGITVLVGGILANTIQGMPGGTTVLGTASNAQAPYNAFVSLFTYVFTVGSFAGIAIVLAVIVVVIAILYLLLGGGMAGNRGK
jgi:hypothetical protein